LDSIRFLELLGSKPAVACGLAYAEGVAALKVDPAEQRALLARDGSVLSRLLDGRPAIYCMISTPDEQAPLKDPGDRDDDREPGREAEDEPDGMVDQ
jgi:hypothetical protein